LAPGDQSDPAVPGDGRDPAARNADRGLAGRPHPAPSGTTPASGGGDEDAAATGEAAVTPGADAGTDIHTDTDTDADADAPPAGDVDPADPAIPAAAPAGDDHSRTGHADAGGAGAEADSVLPAAAVAPARRALSELLGRLRGGARPSRYDAGSLRLLAGELLALLDHTHPAGPAPAGPGPGPARRRSAR
jgi:hypothetical protein